MIPRITVVSFTSDMKCLKDLHRVPQQYATESQRCHEMIQCNCTLIPDSNARDIPMLPKARI